MVTLKGQEVLVGRKCRTRGVEGKSRLVGSWRPTFVEGCLASHEAGLFVYPPRLVEEAFGELLL